MSWDLGWNAQAALLPEQKKFIKVSDRGMQKINAQLLINKPKQSQTYVKGIDILKRIKQKKQNKKNKGVQDRIKKDQHIHEMQNPQDKQSWLLVQRQLEKKQKVYDQLQKKARHHSQLLVDFTQKDLQKFQKQQKQDSQFQALKDDFYAGRLKQIQLQQENQNIASQFRENLHWQRQILQQLKGDLIVQKQKVAQSFDKKLSQEEKQALQKILQEKIKMKKRQKEILQKKQQEKLARLRKLKKLNIL